jgi:hypothetical protein
MANSTLSPGRPSEAIVKLREAALKEMDAPETNIRSVHELSFDHGHDEQSARIDEDAPMGTPVFHGTNNPHVGNGPGPVG